MNNNKIIVAAAGSRKTTLLVEESINDNKSRILIVTYTIDNQSQIKNYFFRQNGMIPKNVEVNSWYSFLLAECIRPYQNFLYGKHRIDTIFFQEGRSSIFVPKTNAEKYYLCGMNKIFTDKMSEFACACNAKSGGLVINRLEKIYDKILIDEAQDLAGYDFEVLELLLLSKISLTIVGDCRQATYFTNCSPKNKKYKGQNIIRLFNDWANKSLCTIEEKRECYRCNQLICDFADKLYPEMSKTISQNTDLTGHDGIFTIAKEKINDYVQKYSPKILRDSIRTDTYGLQAINFGISKGQTFDRVLIFPNGPISKLLKSGDISQLKDKTKANFYVALTRARHSVTFVYDEESYFEEINKLV